MTSESQRDEWEWQRLAACAGMELELFFGPPDEPATPRRRREIRGRRVCSTCPVQRQCLQFALSRGIREGLWGGANEAQRAILRRRRKIGAT